MKKVVTQIILVLIFLNGMSQGINFYDNINFEEPCNYLFVDTANTNLWQIGTPGKVLFDSAYSSPYAIVTDTHNFYSSNNHSKFILKLPHESFSACLTEVTFRHKFDTDTLNDYGIIEVSYDLGNNWNILATDTLYELTYIRKIGSSTYNNMATGKSSGWNYDYIEYWWYLTMTGFPDDIWLRFSFYSDSIQNDKEGWLIDDIEITSHWWSDIKENVFFNSNTYPNPCSNSIRISAYTQKESPLLLYIFDMNGKIFKKVTNFQNEINLNTSAFNNGTYLYKLINLKNFGTSTGKFIVNK